MGKLWLRLLGIGEEEEADLSRRGFLRLLGGAAVVGAVAPTYVFAPSGGWHTDMTAATSDYIVPMLADNVFKPSPIFERLRKGSNLPPYVFDLHKSVKAQMRRRG